MDTIFNAVCVLVTAAFPLALVPGFKQAERSLLARLDQGTGLLAFLVLGLVEEATGSHAGLLNKLRQCRRRLNRLRRVLRQNTGV